MSDLINRLRHKKPRTRTRTRKPANRFDEISVLAKRAIAYQAVCDFNARFEHVARDCDSEIERLLLLALMAHAELEKAYPTQFRGAGGYVYRGDYLAPLLTLYQVEECDDDPAFGPVIVWNQAPIDPYRVDFLIAAARTDEPGDQLFLVVEADGYEFHQRTREQATRDYGRDRDLQKRGYRVMRFTGSEIHADPVQCAQSVFEHITHFFNGGE